MAAANSSSLKTPAVCKCATGGVGSPAAVSGSSDGTQGLRLVGVALARSFYSGLGRATVGVIVAGLSDSVRQQVFARAGHRCEYCLTSRRVIGMPLVVDVLWIARQWHPPAQ